MSLDISTLRQRLQQALGKEFTVGALLGEGGFAAVFRVREKRQHRDVAVKVVDLGLTPSPSLAVRFVREARTVARLEHPHIVPIYKVGGYQNEVLYIVMRCVDGASLRQLLEKKKRLSVRKAATIARQVADALGYAHHYGVVHRDVKPDNILLDRGGHVLVTDFGIAKAAQEASVSQLTTEGMVVGTPQYMSPEQATGDKLDARSDIYSLGILLYQMLAGEPPFDGESAQSILMKQATADPAPIGDHRADVPAPLTAALDRMLAKDPGERYQTAEDVSRALVEAVPAAAGETVPVRPSLLAVVIRSLVGLALLAGGGLVGLTLLGKPPRLSVAAPIPDSVAQQLRRRRALATGDVAQYVFAPAGAEDTTLLLVAYRRVAVVSPHRVRSYPREAVRAGFGADVRAGLQFRLVLWLPHGGRDTVFRRLSFRDLYTIVPRVEKLLNEDSASAAAALRRP
jgi:tRNA A-37 threonylcarbamoyl transferase component Bud32